MSLRLLVLRWLDSLFTTRLLWYVLLVIRQRCGRLVDASSRDTGFFDFLNPVCILPSLYPTLYADVYIAIVRKLTNFPALYLLGV